MHFRLSEMYLVSPVDSDTKPRDDSVFGMFYNVVMVRAFSLFAVWACAYHQCNPKEPNGSQLKSQMTQYLNQPSFIMISLQNDALCNKPRVPTLALYLWQPPPRRLQPRGDAYDESGTLFPRGLPPLRIRTGQTECH